MTYATARRRDGNSDLNRLYAEDRTIHEWYRFVLSFPPHLVRTYVSRFGVAPGQRVLDPFSGTGTVPVECKKLGISSVGVEANAFAQFAGQVKVDWSPNPNGLVGHARSVAHRACDLLDAQGLYDSPALWAGTVDTHSLRSLMSEQMSLLLTDSISPVPLHKVLTLIDVLENAYDERYHRHEMLALAKVLVYNASNLQFGPEVGVGASKPDAAVVAPWIAAVESMAEDLRAIAVGQSAPAHVYRGDARELSGLLEDASVDAVITSPPYPNEKDYTRTTRLESVLLGFVRTKAELQSQKKDLVRSNTRGVFKGDDDDQWVGNNADVQKIAKDIEDRRIQLGKTSGFERMYPRVTKLYFGGMARHLADMRRCLRPGAQLAYVVGDQASYLRVMIRTGQLLADIATALGYEVSGIDLFRTRLATATKEQLREEVVLLRWPGARSRRTFPPLATAAANGDCQDRNHRVAI